MYYLKKLIKIGILLVIITNLNGNNINNLYYSNIFYDSFNDNLYYLNIDKIYLNELIDVNNSLNEGIVLKKSKAIILLSHSGVGDNALFNDLDKLDIKDIINLNNKSYEIYNINYFKKGSTLNLKDDSSLLYLITCDKLNLKKQLLISSKIIDF